MKIKLLTLLTLSSVLVFQGCNKISKNKNLSGVNLKSEKISPPCTIVLIPANQRPRIGFLPDGITPWGTSNPFSRLTLGVLNSNGTSASQVYNPNLLGELPNEIGGSWSLTGLAVNRAVSPYNPSLILSTSSSITSVSANSKHYLLFATMNATNNYTINSQVIVTASFAPASSGWVLHDIEYDNVSSEMYGLFIWCNSSTFVSNSIVARINPTTGAATLVKSYPGIAFAGMDFSGSLTGNPAENNIMYLRRINVSTGANVGSQLYRLNLTSLTETITNLNLPQTTFSFNHEVDVASDGFLSRSAYDWAKLYLYHPLGISPPISTWSTTTSSVFSTITERDILTLPNSYASPVNLVTGFIITDSGN